MTRLWGATLALRRSRWSERSGEKHFVCETSGLGFPCSGLSFAIDLQTVTKSHKPKWEEMEGRYGEIGSVNQKGGQTQSEHNISACVLTAQLFVQSDLDVDKNKT